jgi:hypothetical protein
MTLILADTMPENALWRVLDLHLLGASCLAEISFSQSDGQWKPLASERVKSITAGKYSFLS